MPLRQRPRVEIFAAIRESAAFELATKKDPAAFEALVEHAELGPSLSRRPQRRVIQSPGDPSAIPGAADGDCSSGRPMTREARHSLGRIAPDCRPISADRRIRRPAVGKLLSPSPNSASSRLTPYSMISGHDQAHRRPRGRAGRRPMAPRAAPATGRRPAGPDARPLLRSGRREAPGPPDPGGPVGPLEGGRPTPRRAGESPRRPGPPRGRQGPRLAAPEARR